MVLATASAEAGTVNPPMAATSANVSPGTDHVQHLLLAAGAGLEHPHQPLPDDKHAGARRRSPGKSSVPCEIGTAGAMVAKR